MRASDELLHSVAVWVTDIGMRAAQLPSKTARASFLADKCRELVEEACQSGMDEPSALVLAQSCAEGAERVMSELLARGPLVPGGRA
jgi:hypothetical protein